MIVALHMGRSGRCHDGYVDDTATGAKLYLVGAVTLERNVVSFGAHHALTVPERPWGVLLSAGLLVYDCAGGCLRARTGGEGCVPAVAAR